MDATMRKIIETLEKIRALNPAAVQFVETYVDGMLAATATK